MWRVHRTLPLQPRPVLLVQDVIGTMQKEIHRMQLRKSELARAKEALIKELEKSIDKRDTICMRGRANQASSRKGGKSTEKELGRQRADLLKSTADTEAECAATAGRVRALDAERLAVAEKMQDAATQCLELRQADVDARSRREQLTGKNCLRNLELAALRTAASVASEGLGEEPAQATQELRSLETTLDSLSALITDLQTRCVRPVAALQTLSLMTCAPCVL